MIDDIKTMIDLQEFWDQLVSYKKDIERNNKAIAFWKNGLAELAAKKKDIENRVRSLKQTIKSGELELSETVTRLRKLEDRRINLKTEKELNALEHELGELTQAKNGAEDTLLAHMETLQSLESESASLSVELAEKEIQVRSDIRDIEEKSRQIETMLFETEKKFEERAAGLSPAVKGKFLKLVRSKDGRAISPVVQEICGACHFKIPPNLAIEASKNDKIVICTNCGRFIFTR